MIRNEGYDGNKRVGLAGDEEVGAGLRLFALLSSHRG